MSPQAKTGLLAAGIVGGLFAVGAVGLAVALNRGTGPAAMAAGPVMGRPSPDREGQSWTVNEMIDYLRRSGAGEDVFIRANDGAHTGYTFVRLTTPSPEGADPRNDSICFLRRYEQEETARQAAGSSLAAYRWGRFVFEYEQKPNRAGAARLRAAVQRALD